MIKFVPFLILTLFGLQSTQAQCYSVDSIPYNLAPTTIPLTLPDDGFVGPVAIGFSFCFYGAIYDSVRVGSNGVLAFSPTTPIWAIMQPIPDLSGTAPRNSILIPFQDLMASTVNYSVSGSAPNRVFTVSYDSTTMYSCTSSVFRGQVRLYETTNIIETHITTKLVCPTWNGGRAIHGLHNASGTMATVVMGRNSPLQWTTNNEGIRFTPICNVCAGNSIADFDPISTIDIFPNPASNLLTILSNNNNNISLVEVFSTDGKRVFATIVQYKTQTLEIELPEVMPGLYLVKIQMANGQTGTKKLIIQ